MPCLSRINFTTGLNELQVLSGVGEPKYASKVELYSYLVYIYRREILLKNKPALRKKKAKAFFRKI
jgi:hypothetical protein